MRDRKREMASVLITPASNLSTAIIFESRGRLFAQLVLLYVLYVVDQVESRLYAFLGSARPIVQQFPVYDHWSYALHNSTHADIQSNISKQIWVRA
jgi:hypothetical protein